MIRFLIEQTRLELLTPFRYTLNLIGFYTFTIFIFIGIAQVLVTTTPAADRASAIGMMLMSYLFWFLYVQTSHSTGMNISYQASQGILQRQLINPFGHLTTLLVWILGRQLGYFPMFFPIMFGLAALYGVDVWTPLPTLLLIMTIAAPFLVGLGLIYAGLALVFRQVSSVIGMLQFILLPAALGTHLPAGDRLEPILTWFPYTQAIRLLSAVVVDQRDITWVLAPSQLVPYLASSLLVLGLGIALFTWLDDLALRRGTIGQV